ncbi:MAG: DUF4157 domain-containing protein [Gemmatimonadetes bacterium]|nr:DUF4157 domain-containing protein [Gemmatimonadota bacterium]
MTEERNGRIGRAAAEERDETVQRAAAEERNGTLQRAAAEEREGRVRRAAAEERNGRIQRTAAGPRPTVTSDVERRLDEREGTGEPLPGGVRRAMEDRLGSDLSGVRVHRGGEASSLARRLDAQAFTSGQDIYFGEGKYEPETRGGQELLAHELAHTVQQKGGAERSPARRATVSAPGDRDEQEAERVARQIVRGEVPERPGAAPASLQRQPAEPGAGGPTADEAPPAGEEEPAFSLLLPGGAVRIDIGGAGARGTVSVDLSPYSDRIPGLRLGTLEVEVSNGRVRRGRISGGVSVPFVSGDVSLEVDASGTIGSARGDLTVEVPQFARGRLEWNYGAGTLSGSLTVGADEITVPGLPLKDSSLTITLTGESLSVSGHATTEDSIPGLSEGRLSVAYDNQRQSFAIAIAAELDVPGLQRSAFTIEKDEAGNWKGAGDVAASFAGGSGSLHVEHENFQLRSAEGTVGYSRGPLAGNLTVRLRPPEGAQPGDLAISGEGDLTVRIAPWLTGSGHAILYPDGNVDLSGTLTFPDQVELFKERKFERTLFQFDQEFPLWGITIPLVGSIGLIADIHAKIGARTKFGPAVLRDIVVEGTYSTRGEKPPEAGGEAATGTGEPETAPEPSFAVSGEFFLPAGAELVIIVGGGVGLAALIAELTGGIDLVGTAGAYATLSVRPRFQYQDGKYSFKGVADLQAAAVATLGVNAYAAVEVGIGWLSKEVWRKDWNLASFTWDPGLSLGMQATLDYTLGEPFSPNLEFKPVEIDAKQLVKSAMPESGQPTPDRPRREPPSARMRLEPDPEAPPTADAAPTPADAGRVPGHPGAPRPGEASAGAVPAGAGPTTSGRGEVAVPGGAEPEPAPFVPTRPATADKVPEERTDDEAWQVFAWDRFVDDLEQRTGRRINRAAAPGDAEDRRRARGAEMLDLEEAWKRFSSKSASPISGDFEQRNREEYWNYSTNQWEPRRYIRSGKYKEPKWPLYVSTKKSGATYPAIWKTDEIDGTGKAAAKSGWALGHYGSLAGGGQLITYPRHPREDVRKVWQAAVGKEVKVAADDPRLPVEHHVDHIQELQLGGDNSLDNLQLLNASDNMSSGASLAGQIRSDMDKLQTSELRYRRVTGDKSQRRQERKAAKIEEEEALD